MTAPATQGGLISAQRRAAMVALVKARCQRPVRMLEIGVWRAAGSTQVWLEHLPAGSELVLLDAWRAYASAADLAANAPARSSWDYAGMDAQCEAAFEEACERLRAYEHRHGGRTPVQAHLLRAPAAQALRWMQDGAFDLVYVDGDHKYAQVREDLRQAMRLARPDGGVVCGDDLERLPDPESLALAALHPDRDYLGAPHRFHPGVLLAVHECFGQVHMSDGFWWVDRQQGRFTTRLDEARAEEAMP